MSSKDLPSSKRKNSLLTPGVEMIYKSQALIKDKILYPKSNVQNYTKQYEHVKGMFKRTIMNGESNSALLVGPRGCGKTMLLNTVLDEVKCMPEFDKLAVLVQLNGLVHTDDRLALKDMTRQMGLQNVIGGRVFNSFADNLRFLLDCLRTRGEKEGSRVKSTLVVLEEFDLFCAHHKQVLLYNLFDVAQSAQAPLCVLGLTCHMYVTELLEKRVRSRFSHRQIYLFPSRDDNLDCRLKLLHDLLVLPTSEEDEVCPSQLKHCDIDAVFAHCWNDDIDALVKNKTVLDTMKKLYSFDVSERTFRSFLLLVISRLSFKHVTLEPTDFKDVYSQFTSDAQVNLLTGLSILEMCLIIAMKHHCEIYDNDPLNFEIIYRSYQKFVNQNSSAHITDRSVIFKAFEHLKNLELLLPVRANATHVSKEHQMHHFIVTKQQVKDAVHQYQNLPTDVAQWAASSLQ